MQQPRLADERGQDGSTPADAKAREEVVSKIVRNATDSNALAAAELIPLLLSPRPAVRQTALEALQSLVAESGIEDRDLDALLLTIAGMDWDAAAAERSGFAALVSALGRARLIRALDEPGKRRLGALRLLVS
jgi:hypothetical protein